LLKILVNSVSIKAIEHRLLALDCTCAFCYTIYVPALDGSALAHEHTLDQRSSTFLRRSSTMRFHDQSHLSCDRATSRLLYSCTLTLNHIVPTLERISTVTSNKPEVAKYKVFDFFFWFICLLFCSCILSFIYCY
jgi:hypothetical protein